MDLTLPPPLGPASQTVRLGVIGNRVYQLTATTPVGQKETHSAGIKTFFDSFRANE